MMMLRALRVVLVAVLVASVCGVSVNTGLVNTKVIREIDLTTSIARTTAQVTVKNAGTQSVDAFLLAFAPDQAAQLALVEADSSDGDVLIVNKLDQVDNGVPDVTYYEVSLDDALEAGASVSVSVSLAYVGTMDPLPEEIEQNERQWMLFSGNHVWYSPYTTKKQKTTVQLASSNVESFTKKSPIKRAGDQITCGVYKDVAPYTESEFLVHFENNAPFVAVTKLVKEIEVSHWGDNLAVEESYQLVHQGAHLKNGFSRYDYQRNRASSGVSSVPALQMILPPSIRDMYYRDVIGNISTSNLRYTGEDAEFTFRPRFPLFGGWKTEFYVGYNMPLHEQLAVITATGEYLLTTNIATTLVDTPIIDLTVRVILPEGASSVSVHLPFGDAAPELSHSVRKTYLDTSGRPIYEFTLHNLTPEQDLDFQVVYTFGTSSMLHEPFLLVSVFGLLFAIAIGYQRIDLSIKSRAPSTGNLEDQVLQFNAILENITQEFSTLDAAIGTWVVSGNKTNFLAQRDAVSTAIRALITDAQQIAENSAFATETRNLMESILRNVAARQAEAAAIIRFNGMKANNDIDADELEQRTAPHRNSYAALADHIDDALDQLLDSDL